MENENEEKTLLDIMEADIEIIQRPGTNLSVLHANRLQVLHYSLALEMYASHVLSEILSIKNIKESRSLGIGTKSLSFFNKINLLLDNQTITNDDAKNLELFMSIRNKFMHNVELKTYIDVFSTLDGSINRMKKLYKEKFDSHDLEKALELCVESLYNDGMKTLFNLKGGALEKFLTDCDAENYKKIWKILGKQVHKFLFFYLDNCKGDSLNENQKKELDKQFYMLSNFFFVDIMEDSEHEEDDLQKLLKKTLEELIYESENTSKKD